MLVIVLILVILSGLAIGYVWSRKNDPVEPTFDIFSPRTVPGFSDPKGRPNPAFVKELRRGDISLDVGRWQVIVGIEITGNFDLKTEEKTKEIQRKIAVSPTGIVDQATWLAVAGGAVSV
jgi:peptidoglycan hydrolase-like protein with peptidoglycan-binding domain